MSRKNSRFFKSSPDWEKLSNDPSRPELALKTESPLSNPINVAQDRHDLAIEEDAWSAKNPPQDYGYNAYTDTVKTRDGETITVKIYHPLDKKSTGPLPLLFITHAGGWVQGTPITEEIFLLRPIWRNFNFNILSVSFRLAPEHQFPIPLNDCWDALMWTLANAERLDIDTERFILAGSSAGGDLCASLSHMAGDEKVSIKGVLLNVPVLCHPEHFPKEKFDYTSYDECVGTLLSGWEMRQVWDLYVLDRKNGADPLASPLLAKHEGLPPHIVFVAGQDPVRDEAIAYAQVLREQGVKVRHWVYQGLPHTYAEFDELETTERFKEDLVEGVRGLLEG